MERYSQEELRGAFNLVCDKTDWKKDIKATVPSDTNLDLVREAVIHFTGSVPFFIRQKDGNIKVVADGYYLSVGA